MAIRQFTFGSFLGRALLAAFLVFATYNPSGYSFYHWLTDAIRDNTIGPVIALAGIALLIGWVFYLNATFDSLGVIGLVLSTAFFATIIWLFVDWGLISTESNHIMSYLILVVLSLVLAVGMSWSHIRRRMSGQLDVNDVEDND